MVRTKRELEVLIQKYYAGETTLAEESDLLQHFTQAPYSGEYTGDMIQFIYFKNKKAESHAGAYLEKIEELTPHDSGNTWFRKSMILRAAAIVVMAIGAGWWLFSQRQIHKTATDRGEQTHFMLPDGTEVWLNENTMLVYDQTFNEKQRVITLDGEAYFDVKRDTSRPFIVQTPNATTHVLGTAFNLRSYSHEQSIELTVTHGMVNFGADHMVEVSAGRYASLDVNSNNIALGTAERNADAWKTRKLVFDNTPMREVIRDMERYFHIKFETETAALLQCRFTGSFNDPQLKELLDIITYSVNIDYTINNGKYFLTGQNCDFK